MLWVLICTVHLIVCFYHVTYEFESESTLYSCLNVKKLLAGSRRHIWRLSDCNGNGTHNQLLRKRNSTIWTNWPHDWAVFWVLIYTAHLIVCFYHVTYEFESESTLYSCLNVKEILARSRRDIWRLSDCNGTRIHNHLVRQRTLNHLAKLAKWFSCAVSTYLYGAFDCVFWSCHVRVWERIHTLQLRECQGTHCSKETPNLKIKWLQRDSKPQPLNS